MVKVSASRDMTTPWNFILDPLGTDRRLRFWLLGLGMVETCAETKGTIAATKARQQNIVNGLIGFIGLLLMISLLKDLI